MKEADRNKRNQFKCLEILVNDWYLTLHREFSKELDKILNSSHQDLIKKRGQLLSLFNEAFPKNAVRREENESILAEKTLHEYDAILSPDSENNQTQDPQISIIDSEVPPPYLEQLLKDIEGRERANPLEKMKMKIDKGFRIEMKLRGIQDGKKSGLIQQSSSSVSHKEYKERKVFYELNTNLSKIIRQTATVRQLKCEIRNAKISSPTPQMTPALRKSVKSAISIARKNQPTESVLDSIISAILNFLSAGWYNNNRMRFLIRAKDIIDYTPVSTENKAFVQVRQIR